MKSYARPSSAPPEGLLHDPACEIVGRVRLVQHLLRTVRPDHTLDARKPACTASCEFVSWRLGGSFLLVSRASDEVHFVEAADEEAHMPNLARVEDAFDRHILPIAALLDVERCIPPDGSLGRDHLE